MPTTKNMLRAEDAAATDPARDQSKPLKSFAIRDLSVLAYANGFTLWHYKSDDLTFIGAMNFFSEAADMMTVGDMVMVTCASGATIRVVTDASGGRVCTSKLIG